MNIAMKSDAGRYSLAIKPAVNIWIYLSIHQSGVSLAIILSNIFQGGRRMLEILCLMID